MEFFKTTTNFDFLAVRRPAAIISIILVVMTVAGMFTGFLHFGLDFTGGTVVEVRYPQPADLTEIRKALGESEFKDAVVQHFGTTHDVLIRLALREGMTSAELSNKLLTVLKGTGDEVEMRRVEFVGPQVGQELVEKAGLALIFALLGILIYVALRFEPRLALGAVVATVHDTVITVGIFMLSGIDFDLTALAAVLTVIGYSVNDTVVVYDRIRENFRKVRKGSREEIINLSLNQTLSRTIMTGVSTLMVVMALYIIGGETIHGFALILLVGIFVGTFSSIYVASSLALFLGFSKADLMTVQKEGADIERRPYS